MASFTGLNCCGIKELAGISQGSPANAIWSAGLLVNEFDPSMPRCRYIIFSQAHSNMFKSSGYGYDFAQYIRDNNLGEVFDQVPVGKNPNSGNQVKMWIWIFDSDAMKAWFEKEKQIRGWNSPLAIATKTMPSGVAHRNGPVADVNNAAQAAQLHNYLNLPLPAGNRVMNIRPEVARFYQRLLRDEYQNAPPLAPVDPNGGNQ